MLKIFERGLQFEPRDLWVGLFWDQVDIYANWTIYHIWICAVPLLPYRIRLGVRRRWMLKVIMSAIAISNKKVTRATV